MAESRPPCFIRGGYVAESGIAYVEFTSGGVYSYHGLDSSTWEAWLAGYPYGQWFNLNLRSTAVEFHPQPAWPPGLADEF